MELVSERSAESPEHAGRRDAASSVAPIALLLRLPASLPRTRPARPVDEPSFRNEFLRQRNERQRDHAQTFEDRGALAGRSLGVRLAGVRHRLERHDATSDQYSYVWKTDSAWAGTCRQLTIGLTDGTYYRANFKFK